MKKNHCNNQRFTNRSLLLICFIALFSFTTFYANAADSIAVIPKPLTMQVNSGNFMLDHSTAIATSASNADVKQTIEWFIDKIATSTGYHLSTKKSSKNEINLILNKKADTSLHDEGYALKVTPSMITITANKPAGLFYGLQTVLQLLPPQIASVSEVKNVSWKLPCVDIKDVPRFGWRGLMLDVSRHFFTKQEVEEYIDQMARYKYNTLHLHLAGRVTQSISPLRSHRTVRDSLPSHGSSCFKSQMYCYIMDVPIASVGINAAALCTFVSAT